MENFAILRKQNSENKSDYVASYIEEKIFAVLENQHKQNCENNRKSYK